MNGDNIKKVILRLLDKHGNGMTISNIAEILKLHRHTASRYLFALKEAGYIDYYEVGRAKMCVLKRGLKK